MMNRPFSVSAPGKVILHGEHAVVYGKTALASSLNLRTRLKLSQANIKDTASFFLPDIRLERKWRLDDLNKMFVEFLKGEARLDIGPPTVSQFGKMKEFTKLSEEGSTKDLAVLAVLYLYVSIFGSNNETSFPSIEVHITSELPTGAGLGSSAAFSVCLSAAFLTQAGIVIPVEGSDLCSWKNEDLNLINQWAFEAERIIHGNPSGIDNAVSTYGGALRYQGKQIKSLKNVPLLRIILINTKIPRSTKILVAGVRVKYDKYPAIIGPVFDSIEEIAQKCQLVLGSLMINQTSEEVSIHDVESHPIREQGGIQPDQSPYSSMEELIDMNQKFLEILGVSHPSLEQLCNLTLKHGLHSKLTGAGGGGCTLTIIRPDTLPDTLIQVKEDVAKLGFDLWETSIGGAGVAFHADV